LLADQPIDSHARTQSYHSSDTELTWLDGKRKGHICSTADATEQVSAANLWLQYAKKAWLPAGGAPPHPSPEELAVLSSFSSGGTNTNTEVIEPLHGVARHPFARVGCKGEHHKSIFDITYNILYNNCGSKDLKPRTFLFDMGASVGFKGVPGGFYSEMPTHGGGLSPSLPLFYRLYTDRCLEPDDIFAWEPHPGVTPDTWWGELPASIRAKVRFFETFVGEGTLGAAINTGTTHSPSVTSFLEILASNCKPEDFVIVKLDIDTPEAELTIAQAIARRPDLAALIDEMFFEYHFDFDGMHFGWEKVDGDVDTALALFYRLRTLGIRIHFWI